jgi:hypothetical protein
MNDLMTGSYLPISNLFTESNSIRRVFEMNLAIKAEERHHLIDLSKIAAHFHDSEKREYVKELLTNELKYITHSQRVQQFGYSVASLSKQFNDYNITFITDYGNAVV